MWVNSIIVEVPCWRNIHIHWRRYQGSFWSAGVKRWVVNRKQCSDLNLSCGVAPIVSVNFITEAKTKTDEEKCVTYRNPDFFQVQVFSVQDLFLFMGQHLAKFLTCMTLQSERLTSDIRSQFLLMWWFKNADTRSQFLLIWWFKNANTWYLVNQRVQSIMIRFTAMCKKILPWLVGLQLAHQEEYLAGLAKSHTRLHGGSVGKFLVSPGGLNCFKLITQDSDDFSGSNHPTRRQTS